MSKDMEGGNLQRPLDLSSSLSGNLVPVSENPSATSG